MSTDDDDKVPKKRKAEAVRLWIGTLAALLSAFAEALRQLRR